MPGLGRLLVWVGIVALAAILFHVALTATASPDGAVGRAAQSSCAVCH
jgi:cytochrome c553